jgi:hypothetical protein
VHKSITSSGDQRGLTISSSKSRSPEGLNPGVFSPVGGMVWPLQHVANEFSQHHATSLSTRPTSSLLVGSMVELLSSEFKSWGLRKHQKAYESHNYLGRWMSVPEITTDDALPWYAIGICNLFDPNWKSAMQCLWALKSIGRQWSRVLSPVPWTELRNSKGLQSM